MNRKRLLISIILPTISIALMLILVNKTGNYIERFETKIYQKISGKKPQYIQYDSNGVPFVVYEGKLGFQYNPVTISEQAIKLSEGKDTSNSRLFLNCINWLTINYTTLNDSSIIFHDYFDWPGYKMTSPWQSAMNQGRAMQAFLKAYEKTGDTSYLVYSRKSMNTLFTQVNDGGVTYIDSTGYWYEEYADDSVPQSRVLNGMIVVLQSLSDFHKATNDPDALFLFTKGVSAVKSSLHFYDNKGHSNYDVLGKPASPWYHNFHIELMDFLYSETHDPVFNEYKQKWLLYKEPSYLATLIHKPTRIGVFAVFSIFIGVFAIVFGIGFILTKLRR